MPSSACCSSCTLAKLSSIVACAISTSNRRKLACRIFHTLQKRKSSKITTSLTRPLARRLRYVTQTSVFIVSLPRANTRIRAIQFSLYQSVFSTGQTRQRFAISRQRIISARPAWSPLPIAPMPSPASLAPKPRMLQNSKRTTARLTASRMPQLISSRPTFRVEATSRAAGFSQNLPLGEALIPLHLRLKTIGKAVLAEAYPDSARIKCQRDSTWTESVR